MVQLVLFSHCIFPWLQEELHAIVDVPDPDKLPVSERRELKIKIENDKFDGDHYMWVVSPQYLLNFRKSWQLHNVSFVELVTTVNFLNIWTPQNLL